ncbi:MAG: NAD-dependent epimerase/dehydratase family protein [Myxococcales bacterium]|nr:NAD-dependent epimerase/dehydratase family protein [Myxococcales bacterium]
MTAAPLLFVTGATGCVGRAVIARALAAGWRVRGLARHALPSGDPLLVGLDLRVGSVTDEHAVRESAAGARAIVHLAAWVHAEPRDSAEHDELHRTIVDGTAHVARAAAAEGARLVNASTVAVYGSWLPSPCDEATPPAAESPYARAKLAAEAAAALVPGATSLRIALVHGPHDRGNLLRLLRAIDRGLAFVVGDGTNRKSLVYVEHLAARVLRLIEADRAGGIFIAADAPAPTQHELVVALSRALGRRPPPRLPRAPLEWAGAAVDLARRAVRAQGGSWRQRVKKLAAPTEFRGDRLDALLGYQPELTLDESLQRTVAWWKHQELRP